ncbi:MAG TPA: ferritin-like domain-containing protein [Longimicrobiaceae bacterium]|nr:ferritin-like domain-containing protein [Longimicrobiaceae bacterium]
MSQTSRPPQDLLGEVRGSLGRATDRRSFLRTVGVAGAVITVASCDDDPITPDPGAGVTLDFSSDFGVLNYAYALEQLEAAFYTQAVSSPFSDAMSGDIAALTAVRDHEVAHREFFKAALGANAVGALSVDFSDIDFDSRASVLATAQTFEDLGVGAYNGAAKYLSDVNFLTAAGKIVSVEARHASVIRTMLGNSFAPDAFDDALAPSAVLAAADPYITTQIILTNA